MQVSKLNCISFELSTVVELENMDESFPMGLGLAGLCPRGEETLIFHLERNEMHFSDDECLLFNPFLQ